jgi:hypothetical protein
MNITRQNYESVFIDYYDGKLTADQTATLFSFLKSHPDLAEEFESFNNFQINAPEIYFPFKESLKRDEVNETNFSHYMIGKLEGDLTYDETLQLEEYVKNNSDKLRDQKLFNLTKVKANESIVFENKTSLKQVIPFKRTAVYYAIAAIILIAVIAGSTVIFYQSNQRPDPKVATNVPVKKENQPGSLPSNQQSSQTLKDSIRVESETEKHIPVKKNSKTNWSPDRINSIPENKTELPEIQLAEQIQIDGINQVVENNIVPVKNEKEITAQINPVEQDRTFPNEEYLTVWEALKHVSEKTLENEIMDNREVELANNTSEPAKGKFLGIVGSSIRRLSKDKVRLQTNYDADKQMVAYSFKAGGLSIEKK